MALARREPHAPARRAAAVAVEDLCQHADADAGPCPPPPLLICPACPAPARPHPALPAGGPRLFPARKTPAHLGRLGSYVVVPVSCVPLLVAALSGILRRVGWKALAAQGADPLLSLPCMRPSVVTRRVGSSVTHAVPPLSASCSHAPRACQGLLLVAIAGLRPRAPRPTSLLHPAGPVQSMRT